MQCSLWLICTLDLFLGRSLCKGLKQSSKVLKRNVFSFFWAFPVDVPSLLKGTLPKLKKKVKVSRKEGFVVAPEKFIVGIIHWLRFIVHCFADYGKQMNQWHREFSTVLLLVLNVLL